MRSDIIFEQKKTWIASFVHECIWWQMTTRVDHIGLFSTVWLAVVSPGSANQCRYVRLSLLELLSRR